MTSSENKSDIGLIGLAVMGQNLVLNMNDNGFKVSVFNRTVEKVDEFMNNEAKGTQITGCHSLQELVSSLKKPRRIVVLVKAGSPVDGVLDQLAPLLEQGDIVIDGGNSEYTDTTRRQEKLREQGLLYVGSGVSGGEEGARRGPSLMPGGDVQAWPHIKNIFQSIAAKVDGQPCCDWVGGGGSGHFVKMVHNGIEYADMQVVCESFLLLSRLLGLPHHTCAQVFSDWNEGELESFLIELTRDILQTKDDKGAYVVDGIYDAAGQKGTGKWTVVASVKHQVPLTLIGEAVHGRFVSSLKPLRVAASKLLPSPPEIPKFTEEEKKSFVNDIRKALYMTKIMCYTQGYMLLKEASEANKWDLNYGGIALMWRGGCIIRSVFLGEIKKAFEEDASLQSLLTNHFFASAVQRCAPSLVKMVEVCDRLGFSVPAFSAALSFYHSYQHDVFPHALHSSLYSKRISGNQAEDASEQGHFVKMVHNGIEYADMQVVCESFLLLSRLLDLPHHTCAQALTECYGRDTVALLTELSADTSLTETRLGLEESKELMLSSLDYAVPFTTINGAVYSRFLTGLKRKQEPLNEVAKIEDKKTFIGHVKNAVYMARIVIYTQAFMLLKKASDTNAWTLDLAQIASAWGPAKSVFLGEIKKAFEEDANLQSLLTNHFFAFAVQQCIPSLREVVASTRSRHLPTPVISSALSFYEAFRSEKLPHNLLQALRDYFGAHMYSTLEHPDVFVHTDWSGRGGRVTSTAYNS